MMEKEEEEEEGSWADVHSTWKGDKNRFQVDATSPRKKRDCVHVSGEINRGDPLESTEWIKERSMGASSSSPPAVISHPRWFRSCITPFNYVFVIPGVPFPLPSRSSTSTSELWISFASRTDERTLHVANRIIQHRQFFMTRTLQARAFSYAKSYIKLWTLH